MLKVKDLMVKLNIGRNKAYELMHSKSFPSIRIGKTYYVEAKALDEWLKRYAYKEFPLN